MSFNRRSFLRSNAFLAAGLLLSDAADAIASTSKKINTLQATEEGVTIFHTNDLNGRIAADSSRFGGLEAYQKTFRQQEVHGLLLDGGSFINPQGTLEQHCELIRVMNETGFHATTIGASELSKGEDYLSSLIRKMNFAVVNCNYRFPHSDLTNQVESYVILKYGRHRIGVTGVGPALDLETVTVLDPVMALERTAAILKVEKNCDLVICLAQLGFQGDAINNKALAEQSEHVDFIVGGHNGIPSCRPHGTSVVKNKKGYDVFVTHTAAEAQVLNHTTIASNKTVQVKTKLPGVTASQTAFELAKMNSEILKNTTHA
jgi:5'-nucleotidase